jgi:predicted metal-dependent hydrolase
MRPQQPGSEDVVMKVRILEADFADIGPHWAKNREFAQLYNAASICPAYLEPFLVKVMIEARKELPAGNKILDEQIRIFNLQEMQHCKQHVAFNKMLFSHYPEIGPLASSFNDDYSLFLKTKSLQFNLAYCEGFEAMSAIPVTCFFEDFDELWADSDPRAEALWKWHMAEEYEHREVVHEVYTALYGKGPIAYARRLSGFMFATRHILMNIGKISGVLLAKEREGMSHEELLASKAREKKVSKLASKHFWRHVRSIFSPFYDPGKRPPPRGVAEVLARGNAPVPIAA